jgi:hypothetical protein
VKEFAPLRLPILKSVPKGKRNGGLPKRYAPHSLGLKGDPTIMCKSVLMLLILLLSFSFDALAQFDTYPKPWSEYPHTTVVDSTFEIPNRAQFPKIFCHAVVVSYKLPNDYPSVYSFKFTSPTIPGWHQEVVDTSVEDYAKFSFVDLNSDGYPDLRYRVTPKVRSEYPTWLYNPKFKCFEHSPSFEDFPEDYLVENKRISSNGMSFSAGTRYSWSQVDTVIHNSLRVAARSEEQDYSSSEKFGDPDSSDIVHDYYRYKVMKGSIANIEHTSVEEHLRNGKWTVIETIERLSGGKLRRVSVKTKIRDDQ